jgi:AraC-like DNA-binding protein
MGIEGLIAVEDDGTPWAASARLADAIARWTVGKNHCGPLIPGLTLHRWEAPPGPTSYMLEPSICLIGQGSKRVLLGDEAHVYDADSFLITSVDLPLTAQIIEASIERPYLGLTLTLDLRTIAELMLDHSLPTVGRPQNCLGIAVSKVSPHLVDAFRRLIGLLARPQEIAALAPLIKKEIFYRLLAGEQGPRLRQIISVESHGYQIARTIDWLRDNFRKPFKVEDLAAKAGLSVSAFHNHFRIVTAMSPLQFQKRMRLSEARRLMFTEHMDATTAAFEVGYESPSQFSREYRRLFGGPPLRDIRSLNQVSASRP